MLDFVEVIEEQCSHEILCFHSGTMKDTVFRTLCFMAAIKRLRGFITRKQISLNFSHYRLPVIFLSIVMKPQSGHIFLPKVIND